MRDLRLPWLWLATGGLWVAAVVLASLAPLPTVAISESDKLLHFAAYAALAGWFGAIYLRRWHAVVFGALLALGAVVEWLQMLTGYRSFEWLDICADAGGALFGLALVSTPVGGGFGWIEKRLLKAA